jgi:branched-chain amino acid transport system ATP-binding protein
VLLSRAEPAFRRRVADRAYIIEKGQIRFGGSMAELTAARICRCDRRAPA